MNAPKEDIDKRHKAVSDHLLKHNISTPNFIMEEVKPLKSPCSVFNAGSSFPSGVSHVSILYFLLLYGVFSVRLIELHPLNFQTVVCFQIIIEMIILKI